MTEQFTPTEEDIRQAYEYWSCGLGGSETDEFERFLTKVKATALREAAEVYRSGQLTGIFMGRDDYPREWLLVRAERIERGNA